MKAKMMKLSSITNLTTASSYGEHLIIIKQ